ncbi:hypothetical protein CTEN210_13186 [Chaetoceros tenuissimus]|uniref:SET domain-containing protein n=1 Tax=Chaetoceros tenuissimus TaxID=426638 RepID=A0AAD3D544_9STRA|nr:hypothetical protein CTEN210_13186 [Chaetoceros tenuissimus]
MTDSSESNELSLQREENNNSRRIRPSRKDTAPTLKCPTDEEAKHNYGVEVTKTGGDKGLNVIANQTIKKDTIIIEYQGIIVDKLDPNNKYSFQIDEGVHKGKVLEGKMNEGIAASINHCCEANCEAVLVKGTSESKDYDAVAIIAKRDIKAKEEVTIKYGNKDEVQAFFDGGDCLCEACGGKNWRENAVKVSAPAETNHSSLYIVEVEMTNEEKEKYACNNVRGFIWE